MENVEKHIAALIEKASNADAAIEAMQFAQAALSAAHAISTLEGIKAAKTPPKSD